VTRPRVWVLSALSPEQSSVQRPAGGPGDPEPCATAERPVFRAPNETTRPITREDPGIVKVADEVRRADRPAWTGTRDGSGPRVRPQSHAATS